MNAAMKKHNPMMEKIRKMCCLEEKISAKSATLPSIKLYKAIENSRIFENTPIIDFASKLNKCGEEKAKCNDEEEQGSGTPLIPYIEQNKRPCRQVISPGSMINAVIYEIQLTRKILKGNAFAHIGIGSVVAAANLISSNVPFHLPFVLGMIKAFFWLFGFGYFFDMCDQIQGYKGDAVNANDIDSKKGRPVATGELSIEAAMKRAWFSGLYFFSISAFLGGLPLLLCGLAWSFICLNHSTLSSHFVTKNYFSMSVAAVTMLLASRILTGRSPHHLPSILTALWFGLCIDVQDFRDEKGDRFDGRNTLIIAFGEHKAKLVWATMLAGWTAIFCRLMMEVSIFYFAADGWIFGAAVAGMIYQTIKSKSSQQYDMCYLTYLVATMALFPRSAFW